MQHPTAKKPLLLYRASAGSGKTFLLASQYLCLLFEHPYKYREILAVTFTNKASDEMKHRILGELRKLAKGEHTAYGEIIREHLPKLSEDELQYQANLMYRHIIHDYSRFAVGTIDSFVQQIIRSFAFEIGLDAGYQLELNSDLVKEALADKLYNLLDTDDSLRKWVTDLAFERINEGKHWDFRAAMLELAGEIFKEKFYLFEENMRNLQNPDDAFRQLKKELQKIKTSFESFMKTQGEKGLQLISNSCLLIAEFSHGNAGFANYFNRLTKGDYDPKDRARNAVDKEDSWWPKKADNAVVDQIRSIFPALNKLLKETVQYYDDNLVEYTSATIVLQQLYNLNLLRVLADQLGDYRRENNSLLISDTHNLLRELVKDNEAPFIFEKTGNRFQHFLIDEFQDTSSFQWHNFKPLIEQSISTGSFNLLVGDVKQAIYRWRNGDWRLLLSKVKEEIGAAVVGEETLQQNFRSRKNIIDFNNFIFHSAPQILQRVFNNDMDEVADAEIKKKLQDNHYFQLIESAYSDSFQLYPDTIKHGGAVQVRFFDSPDNRSTTDWRQEANEQLPLLLEELILDKGFRPSQIALLTRKNADSRVLIDVLLQYQQSAAARTRYSIISAEALLVTASPAIQLLMAALQYLNDPTDQLSRANMVQANAIRLQQDLSDPNLYRITKEDLKKILPKEFSDQFTAMRRMSLYECAESLITIFKLDEWTSEQAYLQAFRDIINSFNSKGQPSLRDFLEWWQDEGENKALPAATTVEAVQVMTIHKSKGLAFDVVLVPYADWELENSKGFLWCSYPPATGGIEYVPVKISTALKNSMFAYEYYEEQLLAQMDSLNMLYVAFTRAKQSLIIYAPLQKSKTGDAKIRTVAGLLQRSLTDPMINERAENRINEPAKNRVINFAEQFQNDRLVIPETAAADFKPPIPGSTFTLEPRSGKQAMLLQNEASKEGWLLASAWQQHQLIGKLLHLALSRIESLDKIEAVLLRMKTEGSLTDALLPELRIKLAEVLQHPQIGEWYNGNYTAISERAILIRGGEIRRPDKVLVGKNETLLIDFKFTHEASPSHAKQLQQYKQLLEQMGYPSVKAFVYYGYNQTLVPLVQLAQQQGNLFN
jgi:ATP-dependent helicase/nuclease subunit A